MIKQAISLFLACCFTLPVWAGEVVGTIQGQTVTMEELQNGEVFDLRTKLHEALEQQFKIKTVQDLSKKDPRFKLEMDPSVSNSEVEAVYKSYNLSQQGTLEEMKPKIIGFIKQQKVAEQLEEKYQLAERKGLVKFQLQAPQLEVSLGSAYTWGKKRHKVVVLEFSDYHCPFCGRVQETVTQLRENYGNQVTFAYRHYPLPFHNRADEAAIAAECAREQGKFEEMHQGLFEDQSLKDDLEFRDLAQSVGVKDLAAYDRCYKTEKYRPLVMRDILEGQMAGVSGTPSFFIGTLDEAGNIKGEMFSGAQPKEQFTKLIEKYLRQ